MEYLIYIGLVLLNSFIIIMTGRNSRMGSDHPYHIGLINGIRENKYRFVKNHPYVIGEKNFAYPQFFHWLLSFLPKRLIDKLHNYLNIIISFINISLFFWFSNYIFSVLNFELSKEWFLLLIGIVFLLTPFSFNTWNSKNTGLSPRGFGLMLGMSYLYLSVLYLSNGSIWYFLGLILIVFITVLSSQFTFQYNLFTSVLFPLFFGNYYFILVPIIGVSLFFACMPTKAKHWLIGQYWHKKNYSKYLADIFILKTRYSIWRDFLFDFWVKIKKKERGYKAYILGNPIVEIIIGFPFMTTIFIYTLINYELVKGIVKHDTIISMYQVLFISIIVFVLTSFRRTRFLGEPQRYMEFTIPFISIIAIFLLHDHILWILIPLLLSVLKIMHQFNFFRSKKDRSAGNIETDIKKLVKSIKNNTVDEIRVFSNNNDLLKYFIGEGIKTLRPAITSQYTGPFIFPEMFEGKYVQIKSNVIIPLIKEYNINWFLLDKTLEKTFIDSTNNSMHSFVEIDSVSDLVLYKVLSTNN